ncbi:hypothetical protein AAG906_000621 [Vitis piasezkii]
MTLKKHLEHATDVILLLIYVDDILITSSNTSQIRTGMLDTKSASAPEVVGKTLSITNGDLFPDSHLYRNTVGVFQYVTFARPNILFFVNKACQFMANPTITHWLAVKRILRYLEGTFTHGILIHAIGLLVQMIDTTLVDTVCF